MSVDNSFSSDGRLFQIEYATQAIKLGSIIIGIKTNFCVLLLLEKKKDDILNENTFGQKMIRFNDSLGCVISGLTSDARYLVDQIHVKLENIFFVSNETSSLENCARITLKIASFLEDGNEQKFFKNRPLGLAFLFGGFDLDGLVLLQVDPSGILKKKEFASSGSGQEESLFIIKEAYRRNMSIEETLYLGEKTLKVLTEKRFDFNQHENFLVKK